MKLYEATVVTNYDSTHSGRFQVSSTSFIGSRPVYYTSPYGSYHNPLDGQKSGFFGIPAVGQRVLIAQTVEEEDFYYLGSVFKPDFGVDNNLTPLPMINAGPVPEEIYNQFGGVPQKCVLRDPYGNRLTLSHSYSPVVNQEVNMIELRSGIGKRLALIDSPMLDRIILETDQGDGIRIGSQGSSPPKDLGPNHFIARTKGPMQLEAGTRMHISVVEGTDLIIENKSSQALSTSGVHSGNVNIKSKHKDINITTDGTSGRVLVRAKGSNGVVQINSDGSIIIKAPSDSIFIEGENINIKANSNLNIEAGENVNIKAGSQASMSGSNATVSLAEDAVIDGNFVQLAPPGGVPAATGADSAEEVTNDYGD